MAKGSNSLVLGPRPLGVADGWGDEDAMVDVEDEEQEMGEARGVTMSVTETEATTRTATDTEPEIEMRVLATNDYRDPAQLCKVIRGYHCGVGDRSRSQGAQSLLATAIESIR